MKKPARLMTTTAALLLSGMSLATAQGMHREPGGPAAAPSAPNMEQPRSGAQQRPDAQPMPQNRGSDRGAQQTPPKGKEQDRTTGQGTPGQHSPAAPKRGSRDHDGTTGQAPPSQPPTPRSQGEDGKNRPAQSEPGKSPQTQRQGTPPSPPAAQAPETRGQGSHANLSTEQRTRIREGVLKQGNAPRVNNVTFAISVGTVVPRTIRLAPVPVVIVEEEPTWRGYLYFIVGDDIIVVEPASYRIVAVIAA